MLRAYILAGFDPARFWDLTPRLYQIEMAGATARHRREREMLWIGAMLPHLKEPPGFEEFVNPPDAAEMRRRRVAEMERRFDAIDRILPVISAG